MYKLSQFLRRANCEEGSIVLDIAQGRIFNLNPIGARIVTYLEEGRSEQEIANTISKEFEVSQEEVSSDLREFIEILLETKLLDERGSQS